MNEETVKNWILRAENDLKVGKDEIVTDCPTYDIICFHMQQCVEKYLKVFLIFNGKEIKKTHNIAELIIECSKIDANFKSLYDIKANELTEYAVEIRYGEEFYFPTMEEAIEAIEIAEKVREFVRKKC
ncbi:MAG: HEPN domain-containing protein [Elusimicrobiota bacterium]